MIIQKMKSHFYHLKIILLIALLMNKHLCSASSNYTKFMQTYPAIYTYNDNDAPISTSSPLFIECLCGWDSESIAPVHGTKVNIGDLIKMDFNLQKVLDLKPVQYRYNEATIDDEYSSSVMWFNVLDNSFRDYHFQKGAMEIVINNFLYTLSKATIEEDESIETNDATCEAVLYSADLLTRMIRFVKKTQPSDDATRNNGDGVNYVFCNFNVKYTLNDDSAMINSVGGGKFDPSEMDDLTIVYSDKAKAGNSIEIYKGTIGADSLKKTGINLPKTEPKIVLLGKTAGKTRLFSYKAFIPKGTTDFIDDTGVEDGSDIIKEDVAWPNKFLYTLCFNLFLYEGLAKAFPINNGNKFTSYGKQIWDVFNTQCPVMAWIGKMVIVQRDENKKVTERESVSGLIKGPPDVFLNPEDYKFEDDIKKKMGEIKNTIPYRVVLKKASGDDVKFEQDKEFEELAKKKQEELDAELEEEKNKRADEPSPNSVEPNVSDDNVQEEENDKELSEKSTNEDLSSEIIEDENQDQPTTGEILDNEFLLRCIRERESVEDQLKFIKQPKSCKDAINAAYDMMMYPRDTDECYNDRRFMLAGTTVQFDGSTFMDIVCDIICFKGDDVPVIRKQSVNELKDLECLNTNLELVFKNHQFENPKTAMLYTPIRDAYQEWKKYTIIIRSFLDFHAENKGEEQTLLSLKDDLFTYFETQFNAPKSPYSLFQIFNGPTGPGELGTQGEELDRIMKMSKNYIFYIIRLNEVDSYHDIIYESWYIGDYIMVRLQGSQLDYSAMLHRFAKPDKVENFKESIFGIFEELYLKNKIMTMKDIKKKAYDSFVQESLRLKFSFKDLAPEPEEEGGEMKDPKTLVDEIIDNDYTSFNFSFIEDDLETVVDIYGFIHGMENLPTLNYFFKSPFFEAEYLVPITSRTLFSGFISQIYQECLKHMLSLLLGVRRAEAPGLTDEQVEEMEKRGKYNFPILVTKIKQMLSSYLVYGCVQKEDPNIYDLKHPEVERKFKWDKDVDPLDAWDTGRFIIRRSNERFNGTEPNMCVHLEEHNPSIIDVYPTLLEGGKKGYAISINGKSKEGERVNVTYYIVAYQDYAHMDTFEYTIYQTLDKMYTKVGKPEGGEEKND